MNDGSVMLLVILYVGAGITFYGIWFEHNQRGDRIRRIVTDLQKAKTQYHKLAQQQQEILQQQQEILEAIDDLLEKQKRKG